MNTTHVRNPLTGAYESRRYVQPLCVAICPEPDCAFQAIAVSVDASDVGLWEHTSAIHLGGHHAEVSRT